MLVLAFPECELQARALAAELQAPCAPLTVHRFPDGESRVQLPADLCGKEILLFRSLDHPNEKLVELALAAGCARELGATKLTLVAPYLCYMRQDTAFHPGEAVSQRIIGRWLAGMVDAVITADPHLHRVSSLAEAVPAARAVAVSAAALMGGFLAAHAGDALLLGPDGESAQWVASVAGVAGTAFAVANKTRRGDRSVEIQLPDREYSGRRVVLVDDVASTGRTLAEAARALLHRGASQVDALVTHALFAGDALETMRGAGVSAIWSSDSIAHASNAFGLAPVLAQAVTSADG